MNNVSRRRAPQKQKRGSARLPVITLLAGIAGIVLIFSAVFWNKSGELLGDLESRLADTRSEVENAPAIIEQLEQELAVLEAQKASLEGQLDQNQSAAAAVAGRTRQLERLVQARRDLLDQYK
ncbi:MAG: hypothetical protein LBQ48_00425 [Oscillospiraceae bacterium]|jgi:hypothetical protein|nr:hypothetical protein [Oscillospiraceae bacterium]